MAQWHKQQRKPGFPRIEVVCVEAVECRACPEEPQAQDDGEPHGLKILCKCIQMNFEFDTPISVPLPVENLGDVVEATWSSC